MIDIEILPNEAGIPSVALHGAAKEAADHKNIKAVNISLSHSEVCYGVKVFFDVFLIFRRTLPLLLQSPNDTW